MNTEEETISAAEPAAPEAGAAEPAAPEAAEPSAPAAKPARREPSVPLPSSLQKIVGSLLFASESPLSAADLRECIRSVKPEEGDDADVMSVYGSCTSREIENALRGLEKELERGETGFKLVNSGGTYRLQTVPECGRYVRALLHLDRPSRLSRASLETLAIIAYRQPISKAEIEQIRGVSVDTMVKTLTDLQLVRLVGRSELPGHPYLYGTTPLFLEHFGLSSLQQLNELDPTLQRDDPKERAKRYEKKKPPEPEKKEDGAPDLPGLDANGDVAVEKDAKPPAAQDGDAAPEDGAATDEEPAAPEEDSAEDRQFRPIFLKPPSGGEDDGSGEDPDGPEYTEDGDGS